MSERPLMPMSGRSTAGRGDVNMALGGIELRSAVMSDAEGIARMHYESWRVAYTDLLPASYWGDDVEARWIARWTEGLEHPSDSAKTTVAVRGSRIVGFATVAAAIATPDGHAPVRDIELRSLYIRRADYGSGLADQLLDQALGPASSQLWVVEKNGRAIAFYRRHGFSLDGARFRFGPELGGQVEVRMVR